MFTQQLLEDHLRFLNARGIELAFDRQANLGLLEAVENVRLGDGMNVVVADAPYDGPLVHVEDDDLRVGPVGTVLDFELDVLEELRIPQSLEIPAESFLAEIIALPRKDACSQGIAADAAVSLKFHALGHRGGSLRRPGGKRGAPTRPPSVPGRGDRRWQRGHQRPRGPRRGTRS